eukprot:TRINITY_DN7046_c0_g1_i1.p1 TRINITY_DN7046_c0_g1~~TRINITY_DN7046_c0_g1_i1.p1  ORF type:complete len:394 (-),score=48.65 TRINITY_DN7046_c0_g1_i1:11-1192(-)
MVDKERKSKATTDASTQTEVIARDWVPTHLLRHFSLESEAYPRFLYKSHTLILLGVIVIILAIAANTQSLPPSATSFAQNSKTSIKYIAFSICFFGMIYLPNTLFQRPHPAVWRVILAASVFYLGVLVFILFQNKPDVLRFFHDVIDPNLGSPLPEKSYADDCRLYTPENTTSRFFNFIDALDFYILAHFFGWWVKMLVVRDWKLCMFLSIFFEWLEITFRHWLPNFWECWWDHVILDILVCNGLGILCGHFTVKWLQMKEYRWRRQMKQPNLNSVQNLVSFFKEAHFDKTDWHMFSSTKRFLAVIWYVILVNIVDLSNFFNKYILWIPANHNILLYRVLLWAFISLVSTREYYEYITSDFDGRRIPAQLWICLLYTSPSPRDRQKSRMPSSA